MVLKRLKQRLCCVTTDKQWEARQGNFVCIAHFYKHFVKGLGVILTSLRPVVLKVGSVSKYYPLGVHDLISVNAVNFGVLN